MTIVLRRFLGKLLPFPPDPLESHVPAGLSAYTLIRVSPSPVVYARCLFLAGIVIAVFYCPLNALKLMALENQGADGFERIDERVQESASAGTRPGSIAILFNLDKFHRQSTGSGLGRPKHTRWGHAMEGASNRLCSLAAITLYASSCHRKPVLAKTSSPDEKAYPVHRYGGVQHTRYRC